MRRNGWTRIAEAVAKNREVVSEDEILEALLLAGRRINRDYLAAVCGAMRSLGYRRRNGSRTYVLRPATTAKSAATATGGGQ